MNQAAKRTSISPKDARVLSSLLQASLDQLQETLASRDRSSAGFRVSLSKPHLALGEGHDTQSTSGDSTSLQGTAFDLLATHTYKHRRRDVSFDESSISVERKGSFALFPSTGSDVSADLMYLHQRETTPETDSDEQQHAISGSSVSERAEFNDSVSPLMAPRPQPTAEHSAADDATAAGPASVPAVVARVPSSNPAVAAPSSHQSQHRPPSALPQRAAVNTLRLLVSMDRYSELTDSAHSSTVADVTGPLPAIRARRTCHALLIRNSACPYELFLLCCACV